MQHVRIIFIGLLTGLLFVVSACAVNKSEGSSMIDDNVELDKIVSASNGLGFDFIEIVEPDEHDNVFISPTSLYMALAMAYNGSSGQTKTEIAKALQAHNSLSDFNHANAALLAKLYEHADSIDLQMANSLWIHDQYQFQTEYAKQMETYFAGEIHEVDMFNATTVDMINDWVAEATNGKIEDIVSGPLDRDVAALLINALYFKGDWKYEFAKEATSKSFFHLEDGSTKDINLMGLEEKLPYLETDEFQAVKLPYDDEKLSMNIILPKEDVKLTDLMENLTYENWAKWENEFQEKMGMIRLPKFQLDYETSMKDALIDLGIKNAFDENNADFSNMFQTDKNIALNDMKHKTFIDVNEEGTEAAAATSVEMKLTSAPVEGTFYMEVNRPFFFSITDRETGANLFIGTIYKPEE